MKQVTLQSMINDNADLNEKQKDELYSLVSKGCRANTRERLYHKIQNVPLSCWENFSRYERVYFEGDKVDYCAGQSYPDEIRDLRDLMLGRV